MKKSILLMCACILGVTAIMHSSATAFASSTLVESTEASSELETKSSDITVDEHLLYVEITLPAYYFASDEEEQTEEGDQEEGETKELTQEDLDKMAEESGKKIKYTLNEDGTVTCKMSKESQKELLAEVKKTCDDTFAESLDSNDDSYIASFKEMSYNDDLTEFRIVVDKETYGGFDAFAAMGYMWLGMYYQAFDGVPADDRRTIVNFVDADGNEVESADSDIWFSESVDEESTDESNAE